VKFFPGILIIIMTVLAVVLFSLGVGMKIVHWPMAGMMLRIGAVAAVLAMLLPLLYLVPRFKKNNRFNNKI
jgi:hypothetical protein